MKILTKILFLLCFTTSISAFSQKSSTLPKVQGIVLQEQSPERPTTLFQLRLFVKQSRQALKYNYCGDYYRMYARQAEAQHKTQLYKKAISFYKKAINYQQVDALHSMAYLHYHGMGVPRDFSKALEYLQMAARKDYQPAMLNLAELYFFGEFRVTQKNTDRAEALFIELAKKSHSSFTAKAKIYLQALYTDPQYSKGGQKLSLQNALQYGSDAFAKDMALRLSEYKTLSQYVRLYPSFIPGLSLM